MATANRIYLYFYTDSVGFPSLQNQSADMTWPFLLQELLESREGTKVYVNLRGLGGGRIEEIENLFRRDAGYYKAQGANTTSFAIFNVGVVDAAPRPFTYRLKTLSKVPRIGGYLWAAVSKCLYANRGFFQRLHSYRLTSPNAFRSSFSRMVDHSKNVGLIPISVDTPLTPLPLEERSPGLRDSISMYNSLKHTVDAAVHIPMDWVRDEHYLECGHHFNVAGHKLLADRLYATVRGILHG